jgi:hypothetical protein
VSVHHLHPPYVEHIELAGLPTAALVRFDDAEGPAAWGFQHQCQFWLDEQEPDGVFCKIVAPRLTNHTVTIRDDPPPAGSVNPAAARRRVTVRASILCPDCGLHGWVTDNAWTPA